MFTHITDTWVERFDWNQMEGWEIVNGSSFRVLAEYRPNKYLHSEPSFNWTRNSYSWKSWKWNEGMQKICVSLKILAPAYFVPTSFRNLCGRQGWRYQVCLPRQMESLSSIILAVPCFSTSATVSSNLWKWVQSRFCIQVWMSRDKHYT